jgi:hypothetical protein
MTKFDDSLWREVQDAYAGELSEAPGPLHSHSRLRSPVIAGTSLGIVGASAAAVILLSAASSSPAFAVTARPDGTVSVVIRQIGGIPGANRRLAQLGIRARAVRVDEGCQVTASGAVRQIAVATLVRNGRPNWVGVSPGARGEQIRPSQIPSGRTLVIGAVRTEGRIGLVRGRAVPGAVPACLRPAVQILSGSRGGTIRIVACRGGRSGHSVPGGLPQVAVPGPATNPTSTNSGAQPATTTQTTTNSGTTTNPGTATNSTGTATNSTGTATNATPGPTTIVTPVQSW